MKRTMTPAKSKARTLRMPAVVPALPDVSGAHEAAAVDRRRMEASMWCAFQHDGEMMYVSGRLTGQTARIDSALHRGFAVRRLSPPANELFSQAVLNSRVEVSAAA